MASVTTSTQHTAASSATNLDVASASSPSLKDPADVEKSGGLETNVAVQQPDGGLQGWLCVVGAWLVQFTTWGNLYSYGVYQDYYTRIYLDHYSVSTISWIGSFQYMMPYVTSLLAGAAFDAGYFRLVMTVGSSIFVLCIFMLSLIQPQGYYQAFLAQAVGLGLGVGMTFIPATTAAVKHFPNRRPLASGVALSGAAAGSIIFPIMMNQLIPKVGFGSAVRATAYVSLGCIVSGNLLMRPPKQAPSTTPAPKKQLLPKFSDMYRYLQDAPYLCSVFGCFFILLGSNFPSVYIQLYAVEHRIDEVLAFYSLTIANAGAFIGRMAASIIALYVGPLNLITPTTILTGATIFAVLGVRSSASLCLVSALYGIFSGAALSLFVATQASLSPRVEEIGVRSGLALTIGSFGALVSAPIQGALLTQAFHWVRPNVFAGIITILSGLSFGLARMFISRRTKTWKA